VLDNLYHQVFIDHYKNKRNFESMSGADIQKAHYKNPTCGDVMTLFLQIRNGCIKRATFLGEGCRISMAAASMMTERLKNVSLKEAVVLRLDMENLIRQGKVPDRLDLSDSLSMQGVHALRARHNCALMS